MKNLAKCPKCGSKNIYKTGVGHGIGTGSKIPPITSWGYKCNKCNNLFISHQ